MDGIGPIIGKTVADYFASKKNADALDRLLSELSIEIPKTEGVKPIFEGMNFVITGSVNHFANRNAVKAAIEERGGRVTGSVTSKTNYLINNDTASGSSKNKKAKELGVPIISEDKFIEMLG